MRPLEGNMIGKNGGINAAAMSGPVGRSMFGWDLSMSGKIPAGCMNN